MFDKLVLCVLACTSKGEQITWEINNLNRCLGQSGFFPRVADFFLFLIGSTLPETVF